MTQLEIHPSLSRDTTLYRFVSLETFLALVESRRTHLTKVDEWDDPWEAILDKIPVVTEDNRPLSRSCPFHKGAFGQCWSQKRESDAMWRIYSPASTGVVISTIVERFELLEGADRLYIGPIVYFKDELDLITKANTEFSPLFERLCFKRDAFLHECEVRVLSHTQFVPGSGPNDKYLNLRVEPLQFIEDIIIDPRARSWFVEAVKDYCRRSGFRNEPVQSDLYELDPHETSRLVIRYERVKGANGAADGDDDDSV